MEKEQDLTQKILLCIEERERRVLKAKAGVFAMLLAASLFIAAYGVLDMVHTASRSGFFSFASLFFSDFSAATANFSDLMFSFAESFPVFSVILLLTGILFSFWSLARLLEETEFLHHRTFSALR